jgi:poly(3-hydroxybutyrate) depolymerase
MNMRTLAVVVVAACNPSVGGESDAGISGGDAHLVDGAIASDGPAITTLTPGQTTIQVTVAGHARTAILYVPVMATTSSQFVLALHGNGDTATNFLATSGLKPLADADGSVLVVPQGITRDVVVPSVNQTIPGISWDAYNSVADGNIDLPLLDQLRTQIVATHQVDPQHVFVFGYSQGGYLSFQYGMVTSTSLSCSAVLAASAPFGGGSNDPQIAGAARKLGVVLQIGTNDSAYGQAMTTETTLQAKSFPTQLNAVAGAGHVPIPGNVAVPWAFCRGQVL